MNYQKSLFKRSEGDAWYSRNETKLLNLPKDVGSALIIETLSECKTGINRILEIGSSDGTKLEALQKFFGCEAHGVDPSQKAIAAGKTKFAENKKIQLQVGTADQLEFGDNYFDLVIFGFCLYLVDRELLSASLLEADRVLATGGFLAITDFDPPESIRVDYKHAPGLFTFKDQYENYYLDHSKVYSLPNKIKYSLIAKKSYSHLDEKFTLDPHERIATTILFKEYA